MARPRSDIDRRIVRAARERFLADGVDGASLRAIARSARTHLGMVSYYFPSKDDLFLAVIEDVYAKILGDLDAILAADDAPLVDRLRRLSERFGALTAKELDVVRLVVREALSSKARRRRVLARFRRGHIPIVLRALAGGLADGTLDPSVPVPVLVGAVLGAIAIPQLMSRAGAGVFPFAFPPSHEIAATAARALFEGLGPRPTRRRRPATL